MGFVFKDITQSEIDLMSFLARPIDRLEFDLMSGGRDMADCLIHLRDRSRRCRAAYFDGKLVALYGVLSRSLLCSVGNPWLIATDEVDDPKVRREFIQHTEQEVRWICEGYSHLWNVISCENAVAMRWLKWIGFRFDDETIDVRGHAFRRFSIGV